MMKCGSCGREATEFVGGTFICEWCGPLTKQFRSCDEWWNRLSPRRKMYVHRYFHDIATHQPDILFNLEDEQHEFMKTHRGIDCKGIPERTGNDGASTGSHDRSG